LSFYSFVTRESFGEPFTQQNTESGRISVNWVMPPPAPESGGHINIFRFIRGLEARGFDCRVVVCNDGIGNPISTNPDLLFSQINQWYGSFSGQVCYSNNMPPATVTMVGFTAFTAGSWLSDLLQSQYGMKAYPVSFSYDTNLYYQYPRNDPSLTHLLCYVRPTTERRGWEIVNQALALIHKRKPDVRFILVGGEVDKSQCHYPAFNPGSVQLSELGNLYSQCKAALILSCTNLSLLPLEVMACGVPVISNKGKNVEWLLNSQNAVLADSNPEAMAKAVISVLDMPEEEHNRLVSQSITFARRSNWDSEFDKLGKIINEMTKTQVPIAA